MTSRHLGIAAVVAVLDAALLLIAGAAMWSDAPSSAVEAVGKGLMALGAALAIPALAVVWVFLKSRASVKPVPAAARSDWDAV